MKRTLLCIAFLATGIFLPKVNAQTESDTVKKLSAKEKKQTELDEREKEYYARVKQNTLDDLKEEKQNIIENEKFELKKIIADIDKKLEKGEINQEKATALKKEAAKRSALNIDNRTAIIDNQIALTERDMAMYSYKPNTGAYIALGIGNVIDEKGSFLLGLDFKGLDKKTKYDKRTYRDVVFKSGFVNAVGDGRTIGDSYKFWRSSGFELGLAFKTRLLKDSNYFRLSYGLSYQISMYSPGKDKYFVNENGKTIVQQFPYELKNSFLRTENLVIPVHLEFGPSKKKEYKDYFRYDTSTSFKVGLGGYVGVNTGAVQRLQYEIDGKKVVDKNRADYNVNRFVYGLDGYIGFGAVSLFARYELNPIFENSNYKEHAVSFGVRLDL